MRNHSCREVRSPAHEHTRRMSSWIQTEVFLMARPFTPATIMCHPHRVPIWPALNLLQIWSLTLTYISSPAFLKLWIPKIKSVFLGQGCCYTMSKGPLNWKLRRGFNMLRHIMNHQETQLSKLIYPHLFATKLFKCMCGWVHVTVCVCVERGIVIGESEKYFLQSQETLCSITFLKYWTRDEMSHLYFNLGQIFSGLGLCLLHLFSLIYFHLKTDQF